MTCTLFFLHLRRRLPTGPPAAGVHANAHDVLVYDTRVPQEEPPYRARRGRLRRIGFASSCAGLRPSLPAGPAKQDSKQPNQTSGPGRHGKRALVLCACRVRPPCRSSLAALGLSPAGRPVLREPRLHRLSASRRSTGKPTTATASTRTTGRHRVYAKVSLSCARSKLGVPCRPSEAIG